MNRNNLNIIIFFILLLLMVSVTRAQDTTRPAPKTKTDTVFVQNFILADHNYQYLNKTSPDTLTRKRFLWYPTKSLEDVFNYLPGYYLFYMDVGQLNPVAYNQMTVRNNGVLRNGRPINDLIDGSIDWNLFSRNEISEIELANGYGNNVYGYSNTVNVIQRQLFQFRPYTEISYYQDRYENLYFDGNFHQNLFETVNFNFGITKHSYDGHYINSDFDKWLGRFNLTFAPSSKLNFFANVNYANIKKGLNEGIRADTVNLGSKDELFNSARALVNNPDAYEKKERFDIDVGTVFLAGKSSFTKVQLYVSNSFREYRDEENRATPNGIFRMVNYHWVNYGAKLQQEFKFNLNKNTVIYSNTDAESSHLNTQINQSNVYPPINYIKDYFLLLQEIGVKYRNLNVSGFLQGQTNSLKSVFGSQKLFEEFDFAPGVKAILKHQLSNSAQIEVKGTYNYSNSYFSTSGKFINPFLEAGLEYYRYKNAAYEFDLTTNEKILYQGINSNITLKVFKLKLSVIYNYAFKNDDKGYYPENSGKAEFSFEDNTFKNKLEYKIGFTSRYWSDYFASYYSGAGNSLKVPTSTNFNTFNLKIPANATLDFFIMGKIGKATFGITVENILDRIIYNTGVYPFMDRGGFLNSISRFNITWNFFD